MKEKVLSVFFKIIRVLLPSGALALSAVNGSYLLTVMQTADTMEGSYVKATNYFDSWVLESGNWGPMACILLTIAAIVCAVVCIFKETEKTLTYLTSFSCLAMVGALATLIFQQLTGLGWLIAGLLAANVAIATIQEMKLEDANRRK